MVEEKINKKSEVNSQVADKSATTSPDKIETKSQEEKKEIKVTKKVEIKNKDKAVARGFSLHGGMKIYKAVCRMICRKSPERALVILNEVLKYKRAVPMNDMEIPHRKGDIMAGRYPQKVTKEIVHLLDQLKANASVAGIDNPIIVIAKADKASEPHRREGRRGKRTHVYIEAREYKLIKEKKTK